jgi:hypothetical protein
MKNWNKIITTDECLIFISDINGLYPLKRLHSSGNALYGNYRFDPIMPTVHGSLINYTGYTETKVGIHYYWI